MNRRVAIRTLLSASGVLALAGCQKYTYGLPPLGGRRGGDNNLLSVEVQNAFRRNAETNTILVDVFSNEEGIVILKGNVDNRLQYDAAERIAKRVEGVTRVDNALFIRDI